MYWDRNRYQVFECTNNSKRLLVSFHNLQSAVKWMNNYDCEGMVPIQVFDKRKSVFINVIDNDKKEIKQEPKKTDWKKEGF